MRRSAAAPLDLPVKTALPKGSSPLKKNRQKSLSPIFCVFPILILLAVAINYVYLSSARDEKHVDATTVAIMARDQPSALVQLSTPSTPAPPAPAPAPEVLLQQQEKLITSPTTIVTAYFQIRSKYAKETYMEWMSTMLSLQDSMIIFTTPDWVGPITELRKHALNRTYFVVMELQDVPMAKDYSLDFWQHELDIDPEKKRHAGYEVFWIWLSKTWFVTEGIRRNPFQSDIFMWSDIGCFRSAGAAKYKGKVLMKHTDVLPKDRILFLSHKETPDPPASVWWNNKLREKEHFYHSGSQMLGYKDTFQMYHAAFLQTFAGFIERKLFVGDDQPVFQCACLQNPHLCAYVPRKQVKDNHYFGLRYVVFAGGSYKFWYPPEFEIAG